MNACLCRKSTTLFNFRWRTETPGRMVGFVVTAALQEGDVHRWVGMPGVDQVAQDDPDMIRQLLHVPGLRFRHGTPACFIRSITRSMAAAIAGEAQVLNLSIYQYSIQLTNGLSCTSHTGRPCRSVPHLRMTELGRHGELTVQDHP